MPYLVWDETLDVGVAAFNEDHRRLIDFINELHSALVAGLGIAKMQHIMDGLVDYTVKHFKREEDLMAAHSYPSYEEHRRAHRELTDKVVEFNDRIKSGTTAFSLELMAFLKDWLVRHIKGTDMAYREFFLARGVS